MIRLRPVLVHAVTFALAAQLAVVPMPGQDSQGSAPFHFTVNSNLVLISVVARDRQGNLVKNLTRDDFELLENRKPQRILTFDYENVDVPGMAAAPAPGPGAAKDAAIAPAAARAKQLTVTPELQHRRLVVLFFDLSGMQPEEIEEAVESAQKYVDHQMLPADMVAVASLGTSLQINQDFTTDRKQIHGVLNGLNPTAQGGFEAGSTGTTEGTPDAGDSYTADDTEFNIFNTDNRLEAIQSLADMLAPIHEKKSVIYFAGGMSKTGIENEAELRAAVNSAVRANVSLYTVDTRGLEAMPPGGQAQSASLQGVSAYSGQSTLNQYDSNFDSQETLATLASDTGGQAFFNSNDFGHVYTRVQNDTSAYYILGYRSNNPVENGAFRHVMVRSRVPGIHLEYQAGYYAPRDYRHLTRGGREQQLEDELDSALPEDALPFYLSTGYFRLDSSRYFLSANLAVPGFELPQVSEGGKKGQIDVAGLVRDAQGQEVARLRDRVRLAAGESGELKKRNLQYNTGFVLAPGTYQVRFVVREDENGKMGAFDTHVTIPDLHKQPLQMSSILVGNQLAPVAKRQASNPLTWGKQELVPSVTHVFAADHPLYLYFEVYDPTGGKQKSGPNVMASVMLFRGARRVLSTEMQAHRRWTDRGRKAVVFELEVPMQGLPAGFYACQVNVMDAVGKKFAFPRTPLLIRPAVMNLPVKAQVTTAGRRG